jgi:hypothetical protein
MDEAHYLGLMHFEKVATLEKQFKRIGMAVVDLKFLIHISYSIEMDEMRFKIKFLYR